jgi:arsenate reductase
MIKSNTAVFHSIENEITFFSIWEHTPERKTILQPLIDFIQEKVEVSKKLDLLICTHNSRRSHLSQVWHKRQQHFHEKVFCYSGGTEAGIVSYGSKTLEQAGFAVRLLSAENPVYSIKYGADAHPL